ncbi:MAG: MoaD/ThiS family protein [Bacteroidales bacterium]|nr:MoaD/ThiS family protein [Bacteroidales bacterium]
MKINVKLFATIRLKLGVAGLEIETDKPVTIMELLELVSQKLDADIIPELIEDGEIIVGTILLINGKNVLHAEKLETLITEECEVSVFPPAGGG